MSDMPVEEPVDGEHIRIFLRVRDRGPSSSERLEQRTDETVTYHGDVTQTFFFDHVSSHNHLLAERVALLKSYARGVLSGVSTTLVYYDSSPASGRDGFFGRGVAQCFGASLIDVVIGECRQKGLTAYLGFGVYSHREHNVIDICGLPSGGASPTPTPIEPSLSGGGLFPKMNEINVTTVSRASDVLRQALQEVTRLESRALIPLRSTMFAVLNVAIPIRLADSVGGVFMQMTRLYLMDVGLFSQLKLLTAIGSDPNINPWLQRPQDLKGAATMHPVPLIAFGVGMGHRCVLMADTGGNPDEDVSSSKPLFHLLTCLAQLRGVVTASSGCMTMLGHPPVEADEVPLWRHTFDGMRLRRLVNDWRNNSTRALLMQSREDELRSATDAARNAASQLADVFSSVCKGTLAGAQERMSCSLGGRGSWKVLLDRLRVVREVERDQRELHASLERRRRWLMALPVMDSSGAVSTNTRMELLERSVALLQEENERQRSLFARDLVLLQLMHRTDGVHDMGAGDNRRLFYPVLQGFSMDVESALRSSQHSDQSGAAMRQALEARVDDLALTLKADLRQLMGDDTSDELMISADNPIYAAAVEGLGQAVGVSLHVAASGTASLVHWQQVVAERVKARAELTRVRHMAECLTAHVERSITQLQQLAAEMSKAAVQTSDTTLASSPLVLSKNSTTSSILHRVRESVEGEMKMTTRQIPQECAGLADRIAPFVALYVERCLAVQKGLRDIAMGYGDIPSQEHPAARADWAGLLSSSASHSLELPTDQQDDVRTPTKESSATSWRGNSPTNDDDVVATPTVHVVLDDILSGKRPKKTQVHPSLGLSSSRRSLPQGHFSREALHDLTTPGRTPSRTRVAFE